MEFPCITTSDPKIPGSAEGQRTTVRGMMVLADGSTIDCDKPYYWHINLENDAYLYDKEYPTGWYDKKNYYKILKPLITDYAILTGGISCTFSRDVEKAENAIGYFCANRAISEDIFDFIDLYYSRVCEDERDVCNYSGRIDRVNILYDIVEFAYSFGTITALRYLTKEVSEEVIEESAEKFAREVLAESLEEGVEGWSKTALKKGDYFIYYGYKEVEGGGKLLYLGKSFGDDLLNRYTKAQIKKIEAKMIDQLRHIPNNGTAIGVEQAIMELNGWVADPLLRKNAVRTLSNINNSTTNLLYKKAGINWLNKNLPNWREIFKFKNIKIQ